MFGNSLPYGSSCGSKGLVALVAVGAKVTEVALVAAGAKVKVVALVAVGAKVTEVALVAVGAKVTVVYSTSSCGSRGNSSSKGYRSSTSSCGSKGYRSRVSDQLSTTINFRTRLY